MPTTVTSGCKLCAPSGANLVFQGIERALLVLYGSPGCTPCIRRYFSSHFHDHIEIATTNFPARPAICGGEGDLHRSLEQLIARLSPSLVGVTSTCGQENVPAMLLHYRTSHPETPPLVPLATPSHPATHADGFWAAVHGVATAIAAASPRGPHINLFPGMVSPADLRYLKEICSDFGLPPVLLPDYSDSLDGSDQEGFQLVSAGGVSLASLQSMGGAAASFEFGSTRAADSRTAAMLQDRFDVPAMELALPIGIRGSDALFAALEEQSGNPMPAVHAADRGRLITAYMEAHRHLHGRTAILFGEEDLVVSLACFLAELGIVPLLCGSNGQSGRMEDAILDAAPSLAGKINVKQGMELAELSVAASELHPDLLIASSSGHCLSPQLNIPLVDVGFPLHDHFGGQRLLHVGYRGGLCLLDRIVNALLSVAA